MSFLIDTDLLSMLERKHVPAKLAAWVTSNDGDIFLSVVSLAEIQHGLDAAAVSRRPALVARAVGATRRDPSLAEDPL